MVPFRPVVGHRAGILQVPEAQLAILVLSNAGPRTNLREWEVLEIYAALDEPEAIAADD